MRRLSPAFLTIAMLGVVGLLVVLYVGKKLLARDVAPPSNPSVNVPMALTDLEPGTRITDAHLATGPTSRADLGRDVVLTSRALVGRVVKNKITGAQPISSADLYPPGQNAPLIIEPGNVAATVAIDSPFAATRGQFVDVHFTPSADPDQEETGGTIMTLFRGVKILEISGSAANRNATNVTLELSREQSNIILLAKDRGSLNLVYAPEGRGSGVVGVSDEDRATLYEILGYKKKPEVPEVPPFQTELFQGTGGRDIHYFRDGRRIGDGGYGGGTGNGDGTSGQPNLPPVRRGNLNGYNGARNQDSSPSASNAAPVTRRPSAIPNVVPNLANKAARGAL
ncbi:Flp pilus assembly protein CpaB [Planctomicrobium sp. SH668]|uniref:Flp pilus assembly protein CpaB n=1 Tax=Planctomicrobium sp. SH668 TaxID=3448126 RepID=UPI003F5BE9B5